MDKYTRVAETSAEGKAASASESDEEGPIDINDFARDIRRRGWQR